ncbi:MFS transporter [Rhodanobacter denitrificans]|uniref:MFS transporter n=1 Tax=Rhodanobacter denitrificans TaxID=666685 RepID=A0A368K9R3_9GAMM|nr:MFS transporter [Rhodanobacter denitrificans]RCS28672.1 MFS transporter [Rhodanobacter denitrificans]
MSTAPRPSLFANHNFTLLFGGSTISAIGDQFTLVALPWLVLKLTGDPAALGLVLAAMALPRAAFMLIGGAVVDRMSPRRVLLGARAVNALLVSLLAVLVLAGAIGMGMVYALALGIGLSTAFAYPAGSAILPQLIPPQQLQPANALFMGMRQLSMIVGPAIAGLLISVGAHGGRGNGVTDASGLGLAFGIDAVSFLFSLGSLMLIRIHSDRHPKAPVGGVLANVASGIRNVWADLPLRAFILYAAVVSVFVGGPIQVGLPVLADTRLNLGAASLGILMTANGGGMLLGSALSGVATRLVRGRLGLMVLGIDSLAGLALATLALVHSTFAGAVLLACTGMLAGIAQIAIVSWIQRRVAPEMMGRTMSVLMFTFMGLGPLSAAIAGSLLKAISLPELFVGAGLMLTAIALGCMGNPALRSIGAAKPDITLAS